MEKVSVVTANRIPIKAYKNESEAEDFREELQKTFDKNTDRPERVCVSVDTIELG